MIFDYAQLTLLEGIVAFPDWNFVPLPKDPNQIKEMVTLPGSDHHSQSISQNIPGTVDEEEN